MRPDIQARIECDIESSVGTVTIRNPRRRNALTIEMWNALTSEIGRLDADPAIRSIVVTGYGNTFSAGIDLTDLLKHDLSAIRIADITGPAESAMTTSTTPVVAAISGNCIGGGMLIAAAADLRLATSDAVFGITPAKLGITYPTASVHRLVSLVGPSRAKQLLFTGDFIDATHALRIGLIDELVPDDDLPVRLREVTEKFANRSALTQAASKHQIESFLGGTQHPTPAIDADALTSEQVERLSRFAQQLHR